MKNFWDDLSINDKSDVIKVAVNNGITNLNDIREAYNSFAEGGVLEPIEIPAVNVLYNKSAMNKYNNSDARFVQRIKDPNREVIQDWANDNYIATHKLSYATDDNGDAIVYPNIQEINGILHDFTNPKYNHREWDAYENAIKNNNFIKMTPDEADWFTKEYKKYSPYHFAEGGDIVSLPKPFSYDRIPSVRYAEGGEAIGEPINDVPFSTDLYDPNIDLDLNNLALRQYFMESAFNRNAKSNKGAVGVAQILPKALADYNKNVIKDKSKYWNTQDIINDVKKSAAVRDYFINDVYKSKQRLYTKDSDTPAVRHAKALAAYNFGMGNFNDAYKEMINQGFNVDTSLDWLDAKALYDSTAVDRNGRPKFAKGNYFLPEETRNYIKFILLNQDVTKYKNNAEVLKFVKSNNDTYNQVKNLYGGNDMYAEGGSVFGLADYMSNANNNSDYNSFALADAMADGSYMIDPIDVIYDRKTNDVLRPDNDLMTDSEIRKQRREEKRAIRQEERYKERLRNVRLDTHGHNDVNALFTPLTNTSGASQCGKGAKFTLVDSIGRKNAELLGVTSGFDAWLAFDKLAKAGGTVKANIYDDKYFDNMPSDKKGIKSITDRYFKERGQIDLSNLRPGDFVSVYQPNSSWSEDAKRSNDKVKDRKHRTYQTHIAFCVGYDSKGQPIIIDNFARKGEKSTYRYSTPDDLYKRGTYITGYATPNYKVIDPTLIKNNNLRNYITSNFGIQQ